MRIVGKEISLDFQQKVFLILMGNYTIIGYLIELVARSVVHSP
jgi:hypothetical protein